MGSWWDENGGNSGRKPPKSGRGPDNPSHGIPGRHPGGRTCAEMTAVGVAIVLAIFTAGCFLGAVVW